VTCQHAYCKIIVSEPLTERWADYLGDLLVDMEVERGQIQTTTLIGQPYDLTAYIGLLNVLINLGYTVSASEYRRGSACEAAATDSAEPAHA
jgi:hypothetical protein